MIKLFYRCKNCLLPNTKPDLHFDEKGICMACKYNEYYKSIDWDKRKILIFDLIEKWKKKERNSPYKILLTKCSKWK